MFIKVGGVPGVGKSTLISEMCQWSERLGLPITRVKGGDILMRLAGVKSYDELRQIPEHVREALRPRMFEVMYELDRKDPNIVRLRDAHYALYQPENCGFVEFPLLSEDRDQMYSLVVLTADPELIQQRRKCDAHRSDRPLDLGIIKTEISREKEIALAQAEQLRNSLLEVANNRTLHDACMTLARAIPEGYGRRRLLEQLQRPSGKECYVGFAG